MMKTSNIQTKPFLVYRDGELDKDYIKTIQRRQLVQSLSNKLTGTKDTIKTSIRISLYDALHGTNFKEHWKRERKLDRDAKFAVKIGLIK